MNGAPTPDDSGAKTTGLPVFRTWRALYWFVTAVFAAYVALLAALTELNS